MSIIAAFFVGSVWGIALTITVCLFIARRGE